MKKIMIFIVFILTLVFIPILKQPEIKANTVNNDTYNFGAFRYDYIRIVDSYNIFELNVDVSTETINIDSNNLLLDVPSYMELFVGDNRKYLDSFKNSDLNLEFVVYYNSGTSYFYDNNIEQIEFTIVGIDNFNYVIWDYLNEPIKVIPFDIDNFYTLTINLLDKTMFDNFNFSIALQVADSSISSSYQKMLPIFGETNDSALMVANINNPAIQHGGEVWSYLDSGNYLVKSDKQSFVFEYMDWPAYDNYPNVFTSLNQENIEDYYYFDTFNSLFNFYDYQMLLFKDDFYFNNGQNIFIINDNVFNFVDYEYNNNSFAFDSFTYFVNDLPLFKYDTDYDFFYNQGYSQGYNAGFNAGLETEPLGFTSILFSIFNGFGTLFAIELLPNITIGALILVPIVFGIIAFIIGRRKGD